MWQHGPSMLLLAISVLLLQRLRLATAKIDTRMVAAGLGAAVAVSYTVRPTNAIVVVGFSIYVLVSLRSSLGWYLVGGGSVGLIWVAVNSATYGSLLPPYNTASRLSIHDSYTEAVAANLVSPARGLLLFTPIVAFGALRWTRQVDRYVRSRLRPFDGMRLGVVVVYLLAVSALTDNWWAGHSFGPRFMSDTLVLVWCLVAPLIPFVLDTLAPREQRRRSAVALVGAAAVVTAAAWGVIANAEGGTMRSTLCWNGDPNIDENVERIWSWSDPQLLSGFSAIPENGVREAFLTTCVD
jgi:hypothetical protein